MRLVGKVESIVRETSQARPLRIAAVLVSALLCIACAMLVTGCSQSRDKKAAEEAINKGLHKEALSLHVFIGRVSHKCTPIVGLGLGESHDDLTRVTEYHAAQKAGLITIAPDGPEFWKVELVDPRPQIVEMLKTVPHTVKDGCDQFQYGFGVARKSVAGIVNLREISNEKTETEFTWKWELFPAGEKLLNALSQQERIQVNPYLVTSSQPQKPDQSFSLADMTLSSTPHPGKKTLKKSGDGWVLDE